MKDEEFLKQEFEDIIKASIYGCDNGIHLKSKCRHCLFNAGSYLNNEIVCTLENKK
ncbi:hypothetical protein [Cellulosilyticum sp. I15G10I2]|uniref:hypothetical protein n=1 Tax=Cellulosilyticum sp. I15G10I2 TaxID=1892843 RepID=UPI0014958946|nr:hypothetical protein [Cellulosilyticum sp. I15G10I2]